YMTRLFFKLLGSGLAIALALGVAKPAYAQCPTVVSQSHTNVTCFGFNDGTITVTLSTDVDNFELFDNFLGSFVTISVTENQSPNSVTYTNVYPSSFQVVAFKAGCPALQISDGRSEEHTSELQSRENLVCRLLLEKKKKTRKNK